VDSQFVSTATIVSALFGAIVWNLITWWFGLPSSSSHALVGGLCGATVASAMSSAALGSKSIWSAIIWVKEKPGLPWYKFEGVLYKVIVPMAISPVIGFFAGMLVMTIFYGIVTKWRPRKVDQVFRFGQLFSGSYMGFSHGSNDAQKTMGVIALALVAATKSGVFDKLPSWLWFLRIADLGPNSDHIPAWIKVTCATVMAAGTAAGGWRIIQTMGQKMVRVLPINGFAADATGATVLMTAAHFGMPVSTTHAITTSIMGVGCSKRWSALNMPVVGRILVAWVLTIPLTMAIGFITMRIWLATGWPIK
jgi:PiT family inorganic phosphate transporter